MHTRVALLKYIGKALLQTVGCGLATDSFGDLLPVVVKNVWISWSEGAQGRSLRGELQLLIETPSEELVHQVAELICEIGSDQAAAVREALRGYLCQIPQTIRNVLKRPAEPAGITFPNHYPLDQPTALLAFLPIRRPYFAPGDSPISGVDWQLVELLGVGSFGEVWKARNPGLASAPPVALKFCVDPYSAKVLRSEAKLLDRLMLQGRHPGIIPLRQTYLSTDPPCLEYEFIAGGDLAGIIHEVHRRGRGPSPAQVSRMILRLAKIVGHVHRLDPPIVHRGLKPANILVLRGKHGKLDLRIADFGNGGVVASQAIRQTLRGTSQAELLVAAMRGACTPLYASPQQMRGSEADPRDDVYALGIIWYQFLTGDLSSGRPAGTSWTQRLTEQGMTTPLIELLGSCFADNPDERPRSAIALAAELGALLDEEGETERPGTASAEGGYSSLPRRLTNAIGLTMALIPAGTFRMGSPMSESERGDDEGPHHEVTITQPFYMGIYPVTQKQYQSVMGQNPSYFNSGKGGGPEHPVEKISWEDALLFCHKLSALPAERAAGRSYRLPTEAEWEYACRGALATPFATGMTLSSREANFNGRYPYGKVERGPYLERTTRVGSFPPNPFGLCDMHGNVWEWCSDFYDRGYYRKSPRFDPRGPSAGTLRVVRGGSCYNIGRFCRAAYRMGIDPANRDLDVGFRVVMVMNAGGGD